MLHVSKKFACTSPLAMNMYLFFSVWHVKICFFFIYQCTQTCTISRAAICGKGGRKVRVISKSKMSVDWTLMSALKIKGNFSFERGFVRNFDLIFCICIKTGGRI